MTSKRKYTAAQLKTFRSDAKELRTLSDLGVARALVSMTDDDEKGFIGRSLNPTQLALLKEASQRLRILHKFRGP